MSYVINGKILNSKLNWISVNLCLFTIVYKGLYIQNKYITGNPQRDYQVITKEEKCITLIIRKCSIYGLLFTYSKWISNNGDKSFPLGNLMDDITSFSMWEPTKLFSHNLQLHFTTFNQLKPAGCSELYQYISTKNSQSSQTSSINQYFCSQSQNTSISVQSTHNTTEIISINS